jgi:hypothetical protein
MYILAKENERRVIVASLSEPMQVLEHEIEGMRAFPDPIGAAGAEA